MLILIHTVWEPQAGCGPWAGPGPLVRYGGSHPVRYAGPADVGGLAAKTPQLLVTLGYLLHFHFSFTLVSNVFLFCFVCRLRFLVRKWQEVDRKGAVRGRAPRPGETAGTLGLREPPRTCAARRRRPVGA